MLLAPNIPRGNETTSVCLRALTCWAALEKSDFRTRTRSYSETYILHKKGAHPWVSCLDGSETLCYHLIFSYKLSENSLANATQQVLSRVRIHTMRFSQVWWLNLSLYFFSQTLAVHWGQCGVERKYFVERGCVMSVYLFPQSCIWSHQPWIGTAN